MNKSRAYSKQKAEEPVFGSPIKYGLAVVPFCEFQRCWLLPAGPNQKSVQVRGFGQAMEYAKAMHELISSSAVLAIRLNRQA